MPTTTKRAYRYPSQGAEPDTAGDIQRLAEDVSNDVDAINAGLTAVRTTTSKTFALGSLYKAWNTTIYEAPGLVRNDLEWVAMHGVLGMATGQASIVFNGGTQYDIATLDAIDRPAKDRIFTPKVGNNMAGAWTVYVRSTGKVQLEVSTTQTVTNANFFVSFDQMGFQALAAV
ncbi:hypothetical protein SEA_IDAHO_13 [Arthrobacter phage Idaho]|uniref:Uncharacterized protein n=1 Tax=Arthrobacter phage Idaho TaxID=2565509 RepID=A0A4D6T835_9CAUD|nr:hypothetical protein QEX67_gp13 [Arthrobacter phage Idaho]QCG78278.1 hypothetical protein SEA_IDAHO_13 [Arthrobacter phage Idaho]